MQKESNIALSIQEQETNLNNVVDKIRVYWKW